MAPDALINILFPLVVWAITELIKKFGPTIPGWVIVSVLVPALSAVIAYIGTLVVPESTWLVSFVLGFLATFVRELIKQLSQIGKPA